MAKIEESDRESNAGVGADLLHRWRGSNWDHFSLHHPSQPLHQAVMAILEFGYGPTSHYPNR
jgi:hypothetical protein